MGWIAHVPSPKEAAMRIRLIFLALVALGVAIDVTTKSSGLVALWVFTGAFVALMAPRHR